MIWLKRGKGGRIRYGVTFFKSDRSSTLKDSKNKHFYGVYFSIPVSLHRSSRYYNIDIDAMVFGKQVGNVLLKFEICKFIVPGFLFSFLAAFDKSPWGKYEEISRS